jgi:hypothetical protein
MLKNSDVVGFVKEYFTRANAVKDLLKKIESLKNKEKYQLEIGKVLFGNGTKVNKYTITPYNIEIYQNKSISCEVAFCYGEEIMSVDYSSKWSNKAAVSIMNGYIFFISGEFIETSNDIIINRSDLLAWPTDIPLDELKSMVKWVSLPVKYEEIELENEKFVKYNGENNPDINLSGHTIEVSDFGRVMINKIEEPQIVKRGFSCVLNDIPVYKLVGNTFLPKPIGFSSQIHHIDNNGCNNNIKNLLRITYEQHASIHLFMWNGYKFGNDELKNR